MYRDELEALQARARTLEAELKAEERGKEAVRAELSASRARIAELELQLRRGGTPRPRPSLPKVVLLTGVIILAGAGLAMGLLLVRAPRREDARRQALAEERHQAELTRRLLEERERRRRLAEEEARRVPVPPPRAEDLSTQLRDVLRLHQPLFSACFRQALKRRPSLGELRMEATLKTDAKSELSEVSLQGCPDPRLKACLEGVLRGFELHEVGARTFKVPLHFARQ